MWFSQNGKMSFKLCLGWCSCMVLSWALKLGTNAKVQTSDDLKILALISPIFTDFLVLKIMLVDSFTKAWNVFGGNIKEAMLINISSHQGSCYCWRCSSTVGGGGIEKGMAGHWFNESLVAFVDVIQNMRRMSQSMNGKEWDLSRLTRLMAILKGAYGFYNFFFLSLLLDLLPRHSHIPTLIWL